MKTMNTNWKLLASAIFVSAALAGCGSDGDDGPAGPAGEVAYDINDVDAIKTSIESASYDEASETLSVKFLITDTNGVSVSGAENPDYASGIKIAFGRVGTKGETFIPYSVTGDDGAATEVTARGDNDRNIWLSYTNKEKNGYTVGSGSWNPSLCAEGETCFEYLGNGEYQITAKGIIDAKGFDYTYDASQTQGIFLIANRLGENELITNEKYYWDPATSESVSSPLNAVEYTTCTNCHTDESSMHHSGRYGMNADECSFCHTDYNIYVSDENGTFDGSTKGLVHAAHTGLVDEERREIGKFADVIAVDRNGDANPTFTEFDMYDEEVDSDGELVNDNLSYPDLTSNCQNCHVSYTSTEDTLPSDVSVHALDWFADSDADSCQTCHGDWHHGDEVATDDSGATSYVGCVYCHNSNEDGNRGGAFRHFASSNPASRSAASQAGSLVDTVVDSTSLAFDGTNLTFNMTLKKGDEVVSSEYVDDMRVYVNAVSPTNPQGFDANQSSGSATANTDGSYSVAVDGTNDTDYLPNSLADALTAGDDVAITVSFDTCFDEKSEDLLAIDPTAVTEDVDGCAGVGGVLSRNVTKVQYFKLDGTEGTARASAANYDNCTACHSTDMVMHHGVHYRNADLATCAQCHEADARDSLVVRVHGTNGHGHGLATAQSLVSSAKCQTCHNDNYTLNNARSTPIRWDRKAAEAVAFATPQAAVCASCHVSDSYSIGSGSESARAHIESNGGLLGVDYDTAANTVESCATCHSQADIAENHHID